MSINLHIVRNGVFNDSRVLKETATLRDSGLFNSVEIAGFEHPGKPVHENLDGRKVWRVPIRTRGLPRDIFSQMLKFFEWSRKIVCYYRDKPLALIHCNDLAPLPIATRLKSLTGAPILYDAHELETERAGTSRVQNGLFRMAERRYISAVDAIVTVSPSIKAWYENAYPGIPVSLVRNVPLRPADPVDAMDLRGQLCVPDESLLFVYLGGHAPGRGISTILSAFSNSAVRHHVVFVGDGVLAESVRVAAMEHSNIHWLPPVSPDDVLSVSAGADVGLSLIEDISLSYRFALPNKLFECWIAGIPVMVSDLPDQRALVEEFNAGWIAPASVTGLIGELCSLNRSALEAVMPGVRSLQSNLSWQSEAKELLSVYNGLLAP